MVRYWHYRLIGCKLSRMKRYRVQTQAAPACCINLGRLFLCLVAGALLALGHSALAIAPAPHGPLVPKSWLLASFKASGPASTSSSPLRARSRWATLSAPMRPRRSLTRFTPTAYRIRRSLRRDEPSCRRGRRRYCGDHDDEPLYAGHTLALNWTIETKTPAAKFGGELLHLSLCTTAAHWRCVTTPACEGIDVRPPPAAVPHIRTVAE
jgi:hypothetical protein